MSRLRPSDRVQLISDVGRAIQSAMRVADIPGYLSAFGVRVEITGPVNSKWVLVREALASEADETVLSVARDLRLPIPGDLGPAVLDLTRVLSERGMQVCQEDFTRALEAVPNDPAGAIGHACTSLESIAKA